MALPPLQTLLDLLADNATGDITATDMQNIVTALYTGIVDSAGSGGGGGSIPVGGLLVWPNDTTPTGFLNPTGQAISRVTYADLFALIGTKYGVGDNISTFNLPDYRGLFLRIQDQGAAIDPNAVTRTNRGDGTIGDNVGTKQLDEFKSHSHSGAPQTASVGFSGGSGFHNTVPSLKETGLTGGLETRPKNINVRILIRALPDISTFKSGSIALTTGSKAITPVAHGLSFTPNRLDAYLLCNIANLGYSVGDKVMFRDIRYTGAVNGGIELTVNSTHIAPIQIGDIFILNKTTFAMATITYANWSLVLLASS